MPRVVARQVYRANAAAETAFEYYLKKMCEKDHFDIKEATIQYKYNLSSPLFVEEEYFKKTRQWKSKTKSNISTTSIKIV